MFDFQVFPIMNFPEPEFKLFSVAKFKVILWCDIIKLNYFTIWHLGKEEVVVFSLLVNGNGTLLIKRMRGSFVKLQFHFCLAKNGDSSAKF